MKDSQVLLAEGPGSTSAITIFTSVINYLVFTPLVVLSGLILFVTVQKRPPQQGPQMRPGIPIVVIVMAFLIFVMPIRLASTVKRRLPTSLPIRLVYISASFNITKSSATHPPGLILCRGMEENETRGSHSESTSESLKGWDREGKVRAGTEPGRAGKPGVQSQDPLKGMHSAGGQAFQTCEDYKDSKSLREITEEDFDVFSTSGFEGEAKQLAGGVVRPAV